MVQNLDNALVPLLQRFMENVPGLELALVSTANGSCLSYVSKKEGQSQASQAQANASISKEDGAVGAMFPFVAEQISKLCWGDFKTMTCFFEKKTIVHINLSPVVLSFMGESTMSTGALTNSDMLDRLTKGLEPMTRTIPGGTF